MEPVLNATGYQVDKKEQKGAKFKNKFLFLKTINFMEVPKMFVYISIVIWNLVVTVATRPRKINIWSYNSNRY